MESKISPPPHDRCFATPPPSFGLFPAHQQHRGTAKASSRFEKLRTQGWILAAIASEHSRHHKPASSTVAPKRQPATHVSFDIVRAICRFHLKDERQLHVLRLTVLMKEVSDGPELNESHAKLLLSGEALLVDFDWKKSWPPFMPYASGKVRFRDAIERSMRDADGTRDLLDERFHADQVTMMANRYAASDDGGNDDNNPNGGDDDRDERLRRNKLKNVKLASAHNATSTKIQELREIFQLVDLDGGGTIAAAEMGKLLELMGMSKDEDEIREIMSSIDTVGDGEVNFPDFVWLLKKREQRKVDPPYSESLVRSAFRCFARDEVPVRHIKHEQLLEALTSYEGKWHVSQAREAMRDAGLDGPFVDYRRYVHVMFQLCAVT